MQIISKEEFIKKYGHVKVVFARYYKNTFTFVGVDDKGNPVTCDRYEDIYRFEVEAGDECFLWDIDPDSGTVSGICQFVE